MAKLICAIMAVIPLLACATAPVNTASSPERARAYLEESAMRRQVEELKEQKAELEARLKTLETRISVTPPAPRPRAQLAMPMIPPARPESFTGPPQNWGWLYSPPQGCESGPLSLEIRNETAYFVNLYIDGRQVLVRGANSQLPLIPPGESLYVCLSHTGSHVFAGVPYVKRYNRLHHLPQFRLKEAFGTNYNPSTGRHSLDIKDSTLILYRE